MASSISNDDEAGLLSIELRTNDSSLGDAHIRVPEGQLVYDAIQAAFPSLRADQIMKRLMVFMGDEEMEMNSSFAENGIDDGARLEVVVVATREIKSGELLSLPASCFDQADADDGSQDESDGSDGSEADDDGS